VRPHAFTPKSLDFTENPKDLSLLNSQAAPACKYNLIFTYRCERSEIIVFIWLALPARR
jgi:hypothetical protein